MSQRRTSRRISPEPPPSFNSGRDIPLAVTLVAIWYVWPGYREFAFRLTGWSVSIGLIGVVVWVGMCALEVERALLPAVGLGWVVEAGVRVGFNPFEQLADRPALAYGFFAIRLLGLATVVPLIEEFLLRGFIVRFFSDDPQWWEVPFGSWNRTGIVVMTVLGVSTHPAELLAALVWFSILTWLMLKTRNIWDCVAAHAVTNLLLGIYVLGTGQWQLL